MLLVGTEQSEGLAALLAAAGYEIDLWIADRRDAPVADETDLLVLDCRSATVDELRMIAALRRLHRRAMLLVVSAPSEPAHRVAALEHGADGVIMSPYDAGELLAYARALLRRGTRDVGTVRVADLVLTVAPRQARRGRRRLWLSPLEFDLLYYLASRAGETIPSRTLAADVWGHAVPGASVTYRQAVRGLRKKLHGPSEAPLLHTVWGEGYRVGGR